MKSIENKNFEENTESDLGGWEEVAALAGQMSTSKIEESADAMVDTSGRKYQSIDSFADTITPENTRAYNIDRRNKNYQMLLEKAPDLANLYKNVMTEYPELMNVQFKNLDTKRETSSGKPNAYFISLSEEDEQYRPVVKFNFDEPEVYYNGEESGGDAMALAQSVKKIALSVGVDADEALKNRKFMTSFLLLHELGHALDFKRNYLDATGGDLKEAYRLNRESRRRDEMTMPVPGAVEAYDTTQEEMQNLHRRFDSRFSSMGIHSAKQLRQAETRKYREMHCERMADGFARDYVLKHYEEFFTQADNPGDGKLNTKFEKPIKMGEDFAEVLGIEEGTKVRFTLLSKPEGVSGAAKPGDMIVGYLGKTAEMGHKLALQETNDPADPGWRVSVSGGVKDVYVIPHAIVRQDANGNEQRLVNNEVRFTDADGRVYRVERARDQAKKIEGDNARMLEDLNKKLGLTAGSEVQLLKREIAGRNASPIKEGELKMGRLTTDGITLDGVKMITEDGRSLKTSFIDSIYREWKTFYINTATSTYEVIPVR